MFSRNLYKRALSTTSSLKRKYGGRQTAVLIPGDGLGEEMAGYLQQIFKRMQAPVDFEKLPISINDLDPSDKDNTVWNKKVAGAITAIKRSGVCIMGNINTPLSGTTKSANHQMRNDLGLFSNVVHCKNTLGIETKHDDIDIVLIRENTEGEYSGLEHESVEGVVEMMKIVTEKCSEQLAEFAFQFAIENNRKMVTCIHKANIMKQGDGLFLRTCTRIAKKYPTIEFNDMIVDNTCMQLVKTPQQFDVMILPNLYGNVITNVCCGLTGGSGLHAGVNYNANKNLAIFETATRNTGMSIDCERANPVAFLNAGKLLLEHCRYPEHAQVLGDAIEYAICEEEVLTPDLGGHNTAKDVIKVIDQYVLKTLATRNTKISGSNYSGDAHM